MPLEMEEDVDLPQRPSSEDKRLALQQQSILRRGRESTIKQQMVIDEAI